MNRLALLVAYASALFGVLYTLPNQPEHELGLVYAAHYARDFFAASEAHWSPAWPVTALPPLFYQVVGLLGHVVSIERAYAIGVLAVPVVMVAAGGRLSRALGMGDAGLWLAVNPALWFFLFIAGQAPFLLGVAGATLAAAWLIEPSNWLKRCAACALTIAAACAHPVAGLCVLPALLGRQRVVSLAVIVVAAAASLALLWPMRTWLGGPQLHNVLANKPLFLLTFYACIAAARWGERRAVLALCGALLVASVWILGHLQFTADARHRQALGEIVDAVQRSSAPHAEYLVVGLGHERAQLNRALDAPSLEATPPWWHEDRLALDDTQVRWLISASEVANQRAPSEGFASRLASSGGVMLWERASAPSELAPFERVPLPLTWSLVPLVLALWSALLFVASRTTH